MAKRKPVPVLLIAEPAAAVVLAVFSYFVIAKLLPVMIPRMFPPAIDGIDPAITSQSLSVPFHWIGVAASLGLVAEAWILGRRAKKNYSEWDEGSAPACPLCGGIMKRKRAFFRCYKYPVCSGFTEATVDESRR